MKLPIRPVVAGSPDYPFVAIDAPIKLDQNESSTDLPPALKARVLERMTTVAWNRYPEMHAQTLAQAIGEHDGWPASGVVVTPGSNAMIPALIQLAALRSQVLTVKPGFALYGLDARLLGVDLTEIALQADWSLDVEALLAALANAPAPASPGEPAGVLFLPQPHAPTGSLEALATLETIAAAATGWLVVIDEAYYQFAGSDARELARRHPHVVLLRTFSKAWGLAGVRVGYALAGDEMAAQLRKLVVPFGLSVLQSVAALVALEQPELMRERVAQVISERARIASALADHPRWQVIPSHGNFLLIRTPDAAQAIQGLLQHGVLVRRQDSLYGLEGCIRMTVGTPDQNDAFIAAALQL